MCTDRCSVCYQEIPAREDVRWFKCELTAEPAAYCLTKNVPSTSTIRRESRLDEQVFAPLLARHTLARRSTTAA
jgi:hypothetical protein